MDVSACLCLRQIERRAAYAVRLAKVTDLLANTRAGQPEPCRLPKQIC